MDDLADLSRIPTPSAAPSWRRYLQTIARFKPEQMAHLFARRVLSRTFRESLPTIAFEPRIREGWAPREPFLDDPTAATFRPETRVLRLIQLERTLADPVDWEPVEMPLLWRLELNYFHWIAGDLPWRVARPWIVDWLDHVPRNPRSICWAPFGVAQRILRWTRLVRGSWWEEIRSDPLLPRLLRDLYAQCRWLAGHQEEELLGNHLVKTAVGLYAGGRFFAGGEADRWLKRSKRLLGREVRAQVLPDGGHYERSPMYHLLVLIDLIDTLNVTPKDEPFSDELRRAIEPMHRFAASCAHGDGEVPLFNDSVLDHAPRRDEVTDYAERVAHLPPMTRRPDFRAFPQTGLFCLGDHQSVLWLDAGETGPPFLQAHAHADTASIEWSVGRHRIVCDGGVFSYQDPVRRAWDRSTPAHNTVAINGESSSDCWGSFRVARRARIRELEWSAGEQEQVVTFWHDGFRHLPSAPRHRRTVSFREGVYTIRDRIEGRRPVALRCDGFLYLGPDVIVRPLDAPAEGQGPPRKWSFLLGCGTEPDLEIRIDISFTETSGPCGVFLEPARIAPKFHTEAVGHRLRAACQGSALPLGIDWRLTIGRSPGSISQDRLPYSRVR